MSDSQREFAKALSLVTRGSDERVATSSPRTNHTGSKPLSWHSPSPGADHHFSSSVVAGGGISPPNSEDMSVYDEDFLNSTGFAEEAITDRLGRLRHLQRMSRKGKRQPNWSETENNILVEQFEKYKETLKPKRSEGVSARDKKEAWESICAAVNSSNAAALKRSAKDVRKKWENIRTWARKVVTEWKHDCNQTGSTECPPADPPELARRIMTIYDGDEDGNDFDDDFPPLDTSTNHIDGSNHVTTRQTPSPSPPKESSFNHVNTSSERSPEEEETIKQLKQELGGASCTPRSSSVTPPPVSHSRTNAAHLIGHSAPPLNVPSRRYHRDGLLDYRLLDAARMEERLQQQSLFAGLGLDGNGPALVPSTTPSPPPPKKPRRQRQEDDSKAIRELQRDVLILQKEKLIMEKEKLQMEKDKLRIEKENLLLERHRLISSSHIMLPMMS